MQRVLMARGGYRKWQLAPPRKRGWARARASAVRDRCEVSGAVLAVPKRGIAGLRGETRFGGAIDHVVPERVVAGHPLGPHHAANLICVSASVHARKRRAEDALCRRGDLLTYLAELARMGWPMARVAAALDLYGFRHPLRLSS